MSAESAFEPHRPHLLGIAYRMLGSLAEAEDAVQDAFLRFQRADGPALEQPRAYLSKIVTRLALDRLKSARVRREQYVGTWLPEPLVEPPDAAELADDLSTALLLMLERLSPLERAAFVLHDVFDMDYPEVSNVLQRPESTCRQLVTRARGHVREDRPRFTRDTELESRLAAAFTTASMTGDVDSLAGLLAEDVVFYSDGGGKRHAALNPIFGKDRVLRFLLGVGKKRVREGIELKSLRPARINGLVGFVLEDSLGPSTFSLEIADGQIRAIYLVANPEKLTHLY